MIFPSSLFAEAQTFLAEAKQQGLKLAFAESCTGGLISALFTEVPGSSDVVECGFVTYSNHAKTSMLSVPAQLIEIHGAVSQETALSMAEGVLRHSKATIAVAVTGIAGPGGGTPTKPVGTVHIAAIRQGFQPIHQRLILPGDRSAIRLATVEKAISMLKSLL